MRGPALRAVRVTRLDNVTAAQELAIALLDLLRRRKRGRRVERVAGRVLAMPKEPQLAIRLPPCDPQ
ncbi:hypothetical protein ACIOEW_40265 [Streptomyces sp. NPDC087901]|uniref:hypothetical protein n=1 Tax=Streptomyces sp. NPDC087901 TaxID=3365818 RepID=UPI00380CF51E